MDNAYQPSETLEAITKLIPETFYADRPIEERVKFMVASWQKSVQACVDTERSLAHWDTWLSSISENESDETPWNIAEIEFRDLREQRDKARADQAYYVESLAAGKRPFSDKFSAEVIEGQVKTIQRLESRNIARMQEIANLREDLSNGGVETLLGATVVSQRDRIKELETSANKYAEIEMLLSRRKALDGFATPIEKVAAMLHMCNTADPSGELTRQVNAAEKLRTAGLDAKLAHGQET